MNKIEKENILYYCEQLAFLYDAYSPRIYGFLISDAYCKEVSEELLIKIFLRIWAQIETFNDDNEEKKIAAIVIFICRRDFMKCCNAKIVA